MTVENSAFHQRNTWLFKIYQNSYTTVILNCNKLYFYSINADLWAQEHTVIKLTFKIVLYNNITHDVLYIYINYLCTFIYTIVLCFFCVILLFFRPSPDLSSQWKDWPGHYSKIHLLCSAEASLTDSEQHEGNKVNHFWLNCPFKGKCEQHDIFLKHLQ